MILKNKAFQPFYGYKYRLFRVQPRGINNKQIIFFPRGKGINNFRRINFVEIELGNIIGIRGFLNQRRVHLNHVDKGSFAMICFSNHNYSLL